MNRAEQLEEEEKYQEAYDEYKKQLEKNPDNVEILTRLAHLAMILNKKDDAKNHYAHILEADPSNILAHEQLLDIWNNGIANKSSYLTGEIGALPIV